MNYYYSWMASNQLPSILTGSENIVRIWDAYAKNANKLKITMLIVLYTGYGLGNIITTITTNSAYKINSHVIAAHIMPQISCSKHVHKNKLLEKVLSVISMLMDEPSEYHYIQFSNTSLGNWWQNFTWTHQARPPQHRLCMSLSWNNLYS